MAIRGIEYAAMGYGQYAFSVMQVCHVTQKSNHTAGEFTQALSTLQRQLGVAGLEDLPGGGMCGAGFAAGQALQHAEMALAQPAVLYDSASGLAYRGSSGAISALQIARVYGIEVFARKALAHCFGLRFAQFVQCDVDMALDATLCIPGGFAMANHYQTGRVHGGGHYSIRQKSPFRYSPSGNASDIGWSLLA